MTKNYGTTASSLAAEYGMQDDGLAAFLNLARPVDWDAEISAEDEEFYRDVLDNTGEDGVYVAMTPAELHVTREYLGLDLDDLARVLGVSERTTRRWQSGAYPIPYGVRADLQRVERVAADAVERGVQQAHDEAQLVLRVYRTDDEYWAEHPDDYPYPARFHRAVVARIAHEVPGTQITY